MNQDFEQSIPFPAVIAAFVLLFIISSIIRKKVRQRALVREGQLSTELGRIPSIEERVAGNPAWANGEILSKGRNFLMVFWIAAAAMNLLLGTGFIKALSNPTVKTAPLVTLGVFVAIAVVFGVLAVRSMIRFFRFGESHCCIVGKAGVLNKKMTGIVRSTNEIEATGDYSIELQCVETISTGSGKNRRTECKVHWQSKQQVSLQGRSSKTGIPFSFDLPGYAPETGYQLARGTVSWQLKIHAPVEGVDYSAHFTVPVFKMDYSD